MSPVICESSQRWLSSCEPSYMWIEPKMTFPKHFTHSGKILLRPWELRSSFHFYSITKQPRFLCFLWAHLSICLFWISQSNYCECGIFLNILLFVFNRGNACWNLLRRVPPTESSPHVCAGNEHLAQHQCHPGSLLSTTKKKMRLILCQYFSSFDLEL